MHLIYRHISNTTNKSYIGQTKHTLEWRWKRHIESALNGDDYAFQRAIRKYGIEDWKHEILEDNILTQEEANIAEQFWIEWYNTCLNGYNKTFGGKHCKMSDATREKMSLSATGRKHTLETRNKISQSHKGKKKPELSEINKNRKGVWHQTEIGKLKISHATKGRKQSSEHVRKRILARYGVEPKYISSNE